MKRFKELVHSLKKINSFSKMAVRLGFYLMTCYYIVAVAARIAAPYVANYFRAMAVYRGCLEAAPASLAVGVCAGLLCDLILVYTKTGGKSGE